MADYGPCKVSTCADRSFFHEVWLTLGKEDREDVSNERTLPMHMKPSKRDGRAEHTVNITVKCILG